MDVAEEVGGEFVVAGGEAAAVPFDKLRTGLRRQNIRSMALRPLQRVLLKQLFQRRLRVGGMLGTAPCSSSRSRMRLLS